MWDDPATWALGAALVLALTVPTLVMMGRRMFGRRKQETTMPDEITTVQADPDDRDPQARVREQAMADSSEATEAIRVPKPPAMSGMPHAGPSADEDERRWAAEGLPGTPALREAPIRQTPFARYAPSNPQPLISQHRTDCQECGGRGYMPGINDLLQESVKLLGDQGDEVIRLFYSSLLRAHPQLMTLFPGNPTKGEFGSDHKGAKQRERLLKALSALADLYDPSDDEKMKHLDQALASFGRAHASFIRQDGTIRGATLEEYAAVKEALFATLMRVAADKWKPEYTEAWSQAYDYAAAAMLTEQFRSGFSAPRFPRGN
jgi:hemoglobin-like flavoprotein